MRAAFLAARIPVENSGLIVQKKTGLGDIELGSSTM